MSIFFYIRKLSNNPLFVNLSWNVFGNLFGRLFGPLSQILIARFLAPEDYGVFAITVGWFTIYEIIKDLGITQAIMLDHASNNNISLQFTLQLILSITFLGLSLLVSPWAEVFFNRPELRTLMPLVSLIGLATSFSDPLITHYMMTRNYRLLAFRQLINPITLGVVSLVLAYAGFGVYALTLGMMAGHLSGALILFFSFKEKPCFYWDYLRLLDLLRLGKHILVHRISGFLISQADGLIVGKFLGASSLGFYRVGNQLAHFLPFSLVSQPMQVMYSEFSKEKNNYGYIQRRYYQFINISSLLLFVYVFLVYFLAPFVIPWVMGNQWKAVIPLVQFFSVVVITGAITSLNCEMLKIFNLGQILSYFTMVRSVITVSGLIIASFFSLDAVVKTWVVIMLISSLANEVLFHACQSVIPMRKQKYLINLASLLWAFFILY